jgi:hypothetical protein
MSAGSLMEIEWTEIEQRCGHKKCGSYRLNSTAEAAIHPR